MFLPLQNSYLNLIVHSPFLLKIFSERQERNRCQHIYQYYKQFNLGSLPYRALKQRCFSEDSETPCTTLQHTVAPLGLKIGDRLSTCIKKMGYRPLLILDNSATLNKSYTLLYKKKIGDWNCTFELYFHKLSLYLIQVNINGYMQNTDIDLGELLTGTKTSSKKDFEYYLDKGGQNVCVTQNIFQNSAVIISDSRNSSLLKLLDLKKLARARRSPKREQHVHFQKQFLLQTSQLETSTPA